MTSKIQDGLIAAVRSIMIPIARFLLRHGFTHREFSEIAKWAFVTVATDEYGIRNRRTNVSRVAVMTGLSRKEVRRVRNTVESEILAKESSWNRASLLLRAWYSDTEYLDATGKPASLPFEGDPISFSHLVKRYAGDLPAGAMIRELIRARCVESDGGGLFRPLSRSYIPVSSEQASVRHFGVALNNLAETLCYNLDPDRVETPFFERTTWTMELRESEHPKFQRLVQQHSRDFVEILDDWISAHEDSDARSSNIVTGVGVYFFRHQGTQANADTGRAAMD